MRKIKIYGGFLAGVRNRNAEHFIRMLSAKEQQSMCK